PLAPSSNVLKAAGFCAPVVVVSGGNAYRVVSVGGHIRIAEMLVEHYQPRRIAKRKRPEQNRTRDREQRCGGADAQCDDENGDDGKSGRPEESADAYH